MSLSGTGEFSIEYATYDISNSSKRQVCQPIIWVNWIGIAAHHRSCQKSYKGKIKFDLQIRIMLYLWRAYFAMMSMG